MEGSGSGPGFVDEALFRAWAGATFLGFGSECLDSVSTAEVGVGEGFGVVEVAKEEVMAPGLHSGADVREMFEGEVWFSPPTVEAAKAFVDGDLSLVAEATGFDDAELKEFFGPAVVTDEEVIMAEEFSGEHDAEGIIVESEFFDQVLEAGPGLVQFPAEEFDLGDSVLDPEEIHWLVDGDAGSFGQGQVGIGEPGGVDVEVGQELVGVGRGGIAEAVAVAESLSDSSDDLLRFVGEKSSSGPGMFFGVEKEAVRLLISPALPGGSDAAISLFKLTVLDMVHRKPKLDVGQVSSGALPISFTEGLLLPGGGQIGVPNGEKFIEDCEIFEKGLGVACGCQRSECAEKSVAIISFLVMSGQAAMDLFLLLLFKQIEEGVTEGDVGEAPLVAFFDDEAFLKEREEDRFVRGSLKLAAGLAPDISVNDPTHRGGDLKGEECRLKRGAEKAVQTGQPELSWAFGERLGTGVSILLGRESVPFQPVGQDLASEVNVFSDVLDQSGDFPGCQGEKGFQDGPNFPIGEAGQLDLLVLWEGPVVGENQGRALAFIGDQKHCEDGRFFFR